MGQNIYRKRSMAIGEQMPKKPKPYTRKLKGKTFELIGEGAEAKAWRVSGTTGKRKLGRIFRSTKHKKHRTERDLKKRFVAQTIAHELFPKNVTKPTELDLKKKRIRFKERKMHPELAHLFAVWEKTIRLEKTKNPTKEERKQLKILGEQYYQLYNNLVEIYNKNHARIMEKKEIFDNVGFEFEFDMLNVSLANPKEPVFYEVMNLYPTNVERYLEKRKIPKKKRKRLEKLIAEYRLI